jgi:long-chain acyl-CoA synthetase
LPLIRRLYRIEVTGLEILDGVKGPVIFVCNHNLAFDNAALIAAMPGPWRRRLAIAAAAELWRNPLFAVINPLFGNAFAFSREGSIRPSLENLVQILDEGWNVLIYPEGVLTIGGPIQPFKAGVGLLAVGARVPIVPLRLSIESIGQPSHIPWRRQGRLRIDFGSPLSFTAGDSYLDATSEIEEAVRALGPVAGDAAPVPA